LHVENARAEALLRRGQRYVDEVPSMNAMLDPKMVAAKIQASDTGAHGATVGRARITPSSQDCIKILAIVYRV